jgi:hypothetical protein
MYFEVDLFLFTVLGTIVTAYGIRNAGVWAQVLGFLILVISVITLSVILILSCF